MSGIEAPVSARDARLLSSPTGSTSFVTPPDVFVAPLAVAPWGAGFEAGPPARRDTRSRRPRREPARRPRRQPKEPRRRTAGPLGASAMADAPGASGAGTLDARPSAAPSDGRRHGRDASRGILRGRWAPGCRAAHRQHRWHGGDQQAGQAERREADRERPAEAVTRRPEGTDDAAPPARPQPCGIGRRQDVVAGPGGGRHRPGRRPEGDEIGVQLGAQAAAGDQGLGRRSLGGGRRPVGERGDEDRVVRGMGSGRAWIGHLVRQTGCRRDRFPRGPGQASRVGRREPEVARPRHGRKRPCGTSERAEIVVERGARWAARDDGLGARALRRIELTIEERGDLRGVVILVPTARRQPRNSSIRSSSRSRRASRPRWMRDFTVPSDTPVMSAISA